MRGAEAILAVFAEQGVDTVFGYPGGAVIPLYDALYSSPLRQVLSVHEQGAIHAADGYARATGKIGVCIATSGPGATNIVTGLATAYLDSVPLVVVTGQVATHMIGRDSFQEVDVVGITMTVTKHNVLVTRAEELVPALREAFVIAQEGRPGPVLVDVPSDLQLADVVWQPEERPAAPAVLRAAPAADVAKATAALAAAERPVMLVGGGVLRANAGAKTLQVAERLGLPIVSTLMGLGAVPGDHPQFLGLTGMHGRYAANLAVAQADLVLVVGSRFSDRSTGDRNRYAGQKTIVQLEIDPSEVDKNVGAAISLVGDLLPSLCALENVVVKSARENWQRLIAAWRVEEAVKMAPPEGRLSAPWVMQALSAWSVGKEAIFVSDVGQNQMWAAQHLVIRQARGHLTSGGCGTMGFGLPAAIGAQLARPKAQVVHIAGDGGFKMTGMELVTAVREKLPLLSVVLNNNSLGMVRQWQHLFYGQRYSATLLTPFDFVGFAHSCGAQARRVEDKEGFMAALAEAADRSGPFLLEVAIPAEDMVFPMVAPGAAIDEFVGPVA